MISHKYQCIFIHQRKAAGKSIANAFDDISTHDRYRLSDGVLDAEWAAFAPYLDQYFVFTVVRNPFTRFLSGRKHCLSTRYRPIEDVLRYPPSPNPWHDLVAPRRSLKARLGTALYIAGHWRSWTNLGHNYRHLTRPQYKTVVQDGRLITDAVIYFEDMQTGFDFVCDQIGKPRVKLKSTNPRAPIAAAPQFTETGRRLLVEHFKHDFAYFGYPTTPPV